MYGRYLCCFSSVHGSWKQRHPTICLIQAIEGKCCNQNCLGKFSKEVIKLHREEYHTKTTEEARRAALVTHLTSGGATFRGKSLTMTIANIIVCEKAYIQITGISRGNFYDKKKLACGGNIPQVKEHARRTSEGRSKDGTDIFLGALASYIENNSEYMPHLRVCFT